jgi:hypothetical protein
VAEPKGIKFTYSGELPAHCSYADTEGREQRFDLAKEFTLKDDAAIRIADGLANVQRAKEATTK